MIKIGNRNNLEVSRLVDFGAYLREPGGEAEVLLPARYIETPLHPGDMVDVFVYTDSEDRPVATTLTPLAEAGDVAILKVVSAGRYGAFLDWGLPKDLLVPLSEQKTKMVEGRSYPVYVFLDDASKRVVASAKIEKHLGNLLPRYRKGAKVSVIIFDRNEVGWRCAVDSRHLGILYSDELFSPVNIGDRLEAYVKQVRPDGKIDLTLSPHAEKRTRSLAERIEAALKTSGGHIELCDSSSPDEIKARFQCSKKDFKKAIGHLMKIGKATRESFG